MGLNLLLVAPATDIEGMLQPGETMATFLDDRNMVLKRWHKCVALHRLGSFV